MSVNALIDTFCHNQKKCGTERVNAAFHGNEMNLTWFCKSINWHI